MLEPQHISRLEAAQGWLQLGNWQEANNELEELPASLRAHPQVLNLRFEIYARANDWTSALAIAETMTEAFPDDAEQVVRRSVALHELHRTQEAYDRLLPALTMLPRYWMINYNLTIYLCKLGRIEEAKAMLHSVDGFDNARQILSMAMDDPDLAPLWKREGSSGCH